jgi:hypothetical protein
MTVRQWTIAIGLVVAAVVTAFVVGDRRARNDERLAARQQARADSLEHNAEQLRATSALVEADRRRRVAEVSRDSVFRAQRAIVRARVRIVNDSQLVVVARRDSVGIPVDSAGPTLDAPKEVISEIRSSDAAIAQDAVTMLAQAAELQTLYRRDTLHTERERLLQRQLDETKPQRCGRRCGFVMGVTATVAVTHAGHVVRVAEALVRLFR